MSSLPNSPMSFVCRQFAIMLRSVRIAAFGEPSLPLVKTSVASLSLVAEFRYSVQFCEAVRAQFYGFGDFVDFSLAEFRRAVLRVDCVFAPRELRVCLCDFALKNSDVIDVSIFAVSKQLFARDGAKREIDVYGSHPREYARVVCHERYLRRRERDRHPVF